MVYTVIAENGHSYDLPSKSIGVMEKLDKILRIDSEKGLSIRQKYQKLHEFVKDLLGPENTAEILSGKTINDIDVGELELLILKIQDAYNDAVGEYKNTRIRNSLDSIPADKLAALTEIGKAMTK